ncbi:DNA-binding transcriptional regulator, LysR family [Polaromonas sp. OV174]|uniref:LysR family transcriptional regulator n=1 Tax=Polaromonas sp. OV174 TaxID=1855300 RepID=UPI0008E91D1E|nr:LysR family transcriptional regulator [Polaromonas sp. OV174]SFC72345.1 DNA-binding transcriptional regulator, LysR family [Polaromonas sp. OV174]
MTPDQLRTFAVVASHRNISGAALELNLSQPAVSGQLKLLAESFGEALYHRHGRGIQLTPAGEQLALFAGHIRKAHDEAVAMRVAWREGGGILRIGASTTPASYLLPHLVARFHAECPKVKVAMIRSGNSAEIASRLPELDIGFIEGPVPKEMPADTAVLHWYTDQVAAIVPAGHSLLGARKPVTLAELARYPLVWREAGSGLRRLVEAVFLSHGIVPADILDVTSIEGVKEAVRAGMGVGFISGMAMRDGDPTLATVPLADGAEFRRQFSMLVTHHTNASRACRAFQAMSLTVGADVATL